MPWVAKGELRVYGGLQKRAEGKTRVFLGFQKRAEGKTRVFLGFQKRVEGKTRVFLGFQKRVEGKTRVFGVVQHFFGLFFRQISPDLFARWVVSLCFAVGGPPDGTFGDCGEEAAVGAEKGAGGDRGGRDCSTGKAGGDAPSGV